MRLHIHLDEELVRGIDEIAGRRGRSAFIREALEKEVDQRRRWAAFERAFGAAPDFARHLPDDWIKQGRREATKASERRIRPLLDRHDDPD